jgi:hypothetical protein
MSVVATLAGGASRVERDRSAIIIDTRASTVAWWGTCLLVFVAPFEASEPLLRLPGQSLSTVEAALLGVFAAWTASCAWSRAAPVWRTPLTWPWGTFVAAMLVAALAAPDHRINALHMVGRFGLAFGVYLVTVNGVTTPARVRGVIISASLAGAIVGTLVLLEYLGVGPVFRWLQVFRAGVARVGALIRVGGPFQYPTIASMYLEIAFALTVGLLLMAIDTAGRVRIGAIAALLLLMSGAIMLTFTRSGLITMAVSLVIVGAFRLRQRGFDRGAGAIAGVAVLIAIQLVSSRSIDDLQLRLTTEGQEAWYEAKIDAPSRLTVPAGGTIAVPVTLTNSGLGPWAQAAARFRLSYHWLLPDRDKVVSWEGLRTDVPSPVRPGESVRLQARVSAPRQPGEYRLLWDIEQEHRFWFSTEPDADLFFSRATVTGLATGSVDMSRLITLPQKAVRPRRGVLWRAAARMVAAHPLTGVGPDNYRLLYGEYAGLANADPRTHSNNMYLEVLVGGGFAGGLAFAWLCWSAARQLAGAARSAAGPQMAAAGAGVLAAGAAIAVHGFTDSFLGFTSTYVLFAITIGLAVAGNSLNEAPCA